MKLHPKYIRFADSIIEAMEAFKRGERIQLKGKLRTRGRWKDFNLCDFLDNNPNGVIQYRAKPK